MAAIYSKRGRVTSTVYWLAKGKYFYGNLNEEFLLLKKLPVECKAQKIL
jgi:hypothetical protein